MLNALLKIFTLIGLALLLPVIAISAILIFLEDGRPVFFIQKRIGKDLKVFNIYKLRTMYKDTPNLGTHEVKKSNYLKIGSILRLTKVDELPQLINFIKGELLLIGPRPGLENQLKLRDERLKRGIFSVVPGISGLGQVLGYDMSNPIKLSKIDALYISNKSIQLDFRILIATFFKPMRKSLMLRFRDQLKNIEESSRHV
ncbi:sugar transferase [Gammaproteobacteria bacterium]|nr:sugar transferase [Gammaproteobacteria bacterium]